MTYDPLNIGLLPTHLCNENVTIEAAVSLGNYVKLPLLVDNIDIEVLYEDGYVASALSDFGSYFFKGVSIQMTGLRAAYDSAPLELFKHLVIDHIRIGGKWVFTTCRLNSASLSTAGQDVQLSWLQSGVSYLCDYGHWTGRPSDIFDFPESALPVKTTLVEPTLSDFMAINQVSLSVQWARLDTAVEFVTAVPELARLSVKGLLTKQRPDKFVVLDPSPLNLEFTGTYEGQAAGAPAVSATDILKVPQAKLYGVSKTFQPLTMTQWGHQTVFKFVYLPLAGNGYINNNIWEKAMGY